jgi:hypothetical protein
LCPCEFATIAGLANHKTLVHRLNRTHTSAPTQSRTLGPKQTMRGTFSCSKCPFKCPRRYLITYHMSRCHVEGGVPCGICPCTFATEGGRNAHVMHVHSEREGSGAVRECPKCKRTLEGPVRLNLHLKVKQFKKKFSSRLQFFDGVSRNIEH